MAELNVKKIDSKLQRAEVLVSEVRTLLLKGDASAECLDPVTLGLASVRKAFAEKSAAEDTGPIV